MLEFFDKLYDGGKEKIYSIVKYNIKNNKKMFIITANPETYMLALKDNEFYKIVMSDKSIIIPDGIGIVKASKMLKYSVNERIPGIELAEKTLEFANEFKKSIYLYGAKKNVLINLINVIKNKYPNVTISGYCDGYSINKEKDFKEIIKFKPDIVLVALGMGLQEKLIYEFYDEFDKGILIGVGGSFDVMSGEKKRAPKIIQKVNLEWLYRIVLEPKRFKRFFSNNVLFLGKIFKLKYKKNK